MKEIDRNILRLNSEINQLKQEMIRLINADILPDEQNLENSNTVELIDFAGGDLNHALSAWTSTSRELDEEKLNRVGALLKYLAENKHETPFEKSYIQFLVKCDIATHIHILKHRIGVSVNGQSARYRELSEDNFLIPNDWPKVEQIKLAVHIKESFKKYHDTVKNLEAAGLPRARAKESARFYLPYGIQLYTDVSFNLRSFAHFINLRLDNHAQKEVRDVARKMLMLASSIPNFELSLEATKLNLERPNFK